MHIYICVCVCVWERERHTLVDPITWTSKSRTTSQNLYTTALCRCSSPEDFPGAMDYRDKWWESVREIRVGSATWWWRLVGWLGFYGISTFIGSLTPNPFLCKYSVLFQTIYFRMSTQFNCQKHFYFKQFSLFKQF